MSMVSFPHCPSCPLPANYNPKPVKTHRYGDYIILRPDAESCKKLAELSRLAAGVIQTELSLSEGEIKLSGLENLHLTLAMPLKPMNRSQIRECMKNISEHTSPGSVEFDVVFKGPKDGGSYGFSFTSPNYAPGFDLRLRKAAKPTYNHSPSEQHAKLCKIAEQVQSFCHANALVDTTSNPDGNCNKFNPHITLGKIPDQHTCRSLHERVQHQASDKGSLAHSVSTKAAEIFKCSESGHKFCNKLHLSFEAVEILRVDAMEGGSNKTTKLAKMDLATKDVSIALQLPGCEHKHPEVKIPLEAQPSNAGAKPQVMPEKEDLRNLKVRIEQILNHDYEKEPFKLFKFLRPDSIPDSDNKTYIRFYTSEDAQKALRGLTGSAREVSHHVIDGWNYIVFAP